MLPVNLLQHQDHCCQKTATVTRRKPQLKSHKLETDRQTNIPAVKQPDNLIFYSIYLYTLFWIFKNVNLCYKVKSMH